MLSKDCTCPNCGSDTMYFAISGFVRCGLCWKVYEEKECKDGGNDNGIS